MSLIEFFPEIDTFIRNGLKYEQTSQALIARHGRCRGFSACNIQRFCLNAGINRRVGFVDDVTLVATMERAINQVGPTYGRRMMNGYLRASGITAAERRVGGILRQVHRPNHSEHGQGLRNTNPIQYVADYFGHKLHIDQNEKLVMFGATHVTAVDGYSGKIVSFATMQVKNNLTIYDEIFRSAVLKYGMWDQIQVDHGREFHSSLYMQQRHSGLRFNCIITPVVQTPSTQNHRVERLWVEINNRFNYPLKTALIEMNNVDATDLNDNLCRFCVSHLTIKMCNIGLQRVVSAWNQHRVQGRGIPDELALNCHTARVSVIHFPPASVATMLYQQDNASRLTDSSAFARNPFTSEIARDRCAMQFNQLHPSLELVYDALVNRNTSLFKQALTDMIAITQALCV